MLVKFMSLRKVILFQTAWHYFIMNNDTNNIVLHALLQQMQFAAQIYLHCCSRYSKFSLTLQEPFKSPEKILVHWHYRVFIYQAFNS